MFHVRSDSSSTFLVDGHVHLHERNRVVPTLEAAVRNFCAYGAGSGLLGLLLLTQTARERVFESLAEQPLAGAWRIEPARDEAVTLIAQRGDAAIGIVCGRQVRTDDGLEVLALGTRATFQDGRPLEDSVSAVRESDAIAVLPWAFGKWTGKRGRRIERMLEPERTEWLFVGDNGGRLALAGGPRLLVTAERRGFRLLPGTDPFPVADDYHRTGSFGFRLESAPPAAAPWRGVREALTSQRSSPERYGRPSGPLRFLVNQVAIRMR